MQFETELKVLAKKIAEQSKHEAHALSSVYCGIYMQCLYLNSTTSQTIHHINMPVLADCIKNIAQQFESAFSKRTISHSEIIDYLNRLAQFVGEYPHMSTVDGYAHLFDTHPRLPERVGINTDGLSAIGDIVRAFLIRAKEVKLYKWAPSNASILRRYETVDTSVFWERCRLFSIDHASSLSTDEFLASVRSRYIASVMDKRALYAWACQSYAKTKDFYMCMREIQPDNINGAHRTGSTPIIVALEDEDKDSKCDELQEIIMCSVLTTFLDSGYYSDVYRDRPPSQAQMRSHKTKSSLGNFCGQYVTIDNNGAMTQHGSGPEGLKSIILAYTEKHNRTLFDYLSGRSETHRDLTDEDLYFTESCF